jgi:hypothetical protein
MHIKIFDSNGELISKVPVEGWEDGFNRLCIEAKRDPNFYRGRVYDFDDGVEYPIITIEKEFKFTF